MRRAIAPLIFYSDYTVHIDQAWIHASMGADEDDPREDPRIVETL